MAPLPSLVYNNVLSLRADKKYEVKVEKEILLGKLILGLIAAAFAMFLGYTIYLKLKPKYQKEWKPKLHPKLRDYKEKYEGRKKQMGTWHGPKEPRKSQQFPSKIVLDTNVPSRGASACSHSW
ncbi:hypothetical protein Pdw03_3555 [Penicillium digitatum]|uniref:Uncharacterized protein n=3 Tax=Penicillium digitatum TaxID=36651 RepID=K9FFG5_PEND2|nr:hypothetical protein PDIP_79040 [Penicillium digitatum Pd1]EKV06462.1 hypothetical protein PDIP_79040 [Penicillium digitatum Pd1]EKV08210.1 hypothetical protein PDIG_69750 [Penicillium digitatum PHI26]QQK40701.1 hypothetical protein Pdw03_3555 [Penicillium digitatum]